MAYTMFNSIIWYVELNVYIIQSDSQSYLTKHVYYLKVLVNILLIANVLHWQMGIVTHVAISVLSLNHSRFTTTKHVLYAVL